MSFKGVKARTSWGCETFNKGRLTLGKMNVKGKTLVVYLALDPSAYEGTKYHFKDVSAKAKFSKVPMLFKVRSMRSLRYVVDLIGEMMEKYEVKLGQLSDVDFRPAPMTVDELIENNLIKVTLPENVNFVANTQPATQEAPEEQITEADENA
jgi:hypothetical protein